MQIALTEPVSPAIGAMSCALAAKGLVYGSVCSGIEAATAAWEPLGWRAAFFAEIDGPVVPPGGKWSDAGVVVGPARTVAWRVLDAQYFGLAQRRRRVFVVAGAGDRADPVPVLLERQGLRRDSPPSREAGQGAAGSAACRAYGGNNTSGPIDVATALSRLRFIYRRGAPSLLVAENMRARTGKRGGFAKGSASALRTGRGLATVVIFILVPQVSLKKRFDVDAAAERWASALPELIVRNWRE